MRWFALVVAVVIPPLALLFLRAPPDAISATGVRAPGGAIAFAPVAGIPPGVVMAMLAAAIFCCCTAMSMPLAHIVAFCSGMGIGLMPGAAMLSLQLAAGVLAQQVWGWAMDRVGALRTILFASAGMATAMTGFMLTQNEFGLFSISALFGLAFGGLIPGYILAVREIFPVDEASWRIPIVMFPGALGMAAGGWLAGAMYDRFGFYAPAFGAGIAFNIANLIIIGTLVRRHAASAGDGLNLEVQRAPQAEVNGVVAARTARGAGDLGVGDVLGRETEVQELDRQSERAQGSQATAAMRPAALGRLPAHPY